VTIVWTETARLNLSEILDFVATDSESAARELLNKIRTHAELLARFPGLGRVGRIPNTRELPVPGTRFVLPYMVEGEKVVVLAVFHGAREWPEHLEQL
jgi:plasmid stabilization system protein ParE